MTKQELIDWTKTAEVVDYRSHEDDGNIYMFKIYKKDDELFLVNYCNAGPTEKWGERGYIRGEYELIKVSVKKKIIAVEITQYVDENGEIRESTEMYIGDRYAD